MLPYWVVSHIIAIVRLVAQIVTFTAMDLDRYHQYINAHCGHCSTPRLTEQGEETHSSSGTAAPGSW